MNGVSEVLEQGQLVIVRHRPALIREVTSIVNHDTKVNEHLVNIEYIDGWSFPAEDTVLWEREVGVKVLSRISLPNIGSPQEPPDMPDRFDAFLDAMRWSSQGKMMTLVDLPVDYTSCSILSPWRSAVQIEDYQLYPVLKAMAMPRVSLLLADDVGVGKTIEAGLILSELIAQRGIRRILILCPASIQDQWKEELKDKFNLDFVKMNSAEVFNIQKTLGMDANPWTIYPRVITSMDYLRQQDILNRFTTGAVKLQPEASVLLPWDLLIVDEVHNLAPSQYGDDSLRCQMLRDISRFFEHRLFLTATPHDGFTVTFTGLMELLDPLRFIQKTSMDDRDHAQIQASVVRRMKSELNENRAVPRFVHRNVCGIPTKLSKDEKQLFDALRKYRSAGIKLASRQGKRERNLGSFIFSILSKRLLSSSYAFARTWWKHCEGFQLEGFGFDEANQSRKRAETPVDDDSEKERRETDAVRHGAGWLQRFSKELSSNIDEISSILNEMGWSKKQVEENISTVASFPPDTKWDALILWIQEHLISDKKFRTDERLIIFTEYKDTQNYLVTRLRKQLGWCFPTVQIMFGGESEIQDTISKESVKRSVVKQEFNDPKSPLRILIATDVAAEGLNLQTSCRYVIHQEIPWNPMRMEQRNGRVDRYGQARDVTVCHFTSDEDADIQFLSYIANKVNQVREDLGSVGQVLDESVLEHFSGKLLKAEDVEQRIIKASSASMVKKDLKLRDKGAEYEYERSIQNLQATELQMGLTEMHVSRLLLQALQLEHGSLREESPGVYRFDVIPPSWKPLVLSTLAIKEGSQAGSLPKIVFDPKYLVVTEYNRSLFRPRNDMALLRIGNPVMQKAMTAMRRQLWCDIGGGVNRWTILQASLPAGIDIAATLSCNITVRNSLNELLYSMIYDIPFVLTKNGAKKIDRKLWAEIKQLPIEMLDSKKIDYWRPILHECWLEGKTNLTKEISALQEKVKADFTKSCTSTLKKQLVEETKLYELRLKELDTEKNPRTLERLKKELTKAEDQALQMTFSEEKNRERKERLKELEGRLSDEEWERQHTQVMLLKQRLEAERERVLTKVLPKRYQVATVNIQPVAVKILVREGS